MVQETTQTRPAAAAAAPKLVGLVAEFTSPEALIAASQQVRSAGYQRIDAFTPFPVHGLDRALGIRPTRLPWVVLLAGLTGGLLALAGQWWTNAIDYPVVISGKPLFSLPANIPVVFEVIILFSAFAAFLGMLAFNGLPKHSNPLFDSARFLRATNDRFFLVIDAADPQFDAQQSAELLESLGASAVEPCHQPVQDQPLPRVTYAVLLIGVCLALIPPALIARARVTTSAKPRWHTFTDMDYQPKFRAQAAAPPTIFRDRHASRLPVPGTIARGQLFADSRLYRGIEPGSPAPEPTAGGQTSATGTAAQAAATAETPDPTDAPDPTAPTDAPAPPADASGPTDAPAPPADASGPAAEEPEPDWVTRIPLPVTIERMRQGRLRYNIYCAPCHGRAGDGDGIVSQAALAREQGTWVPPLSLHAPSVLEQPVGQLYNTITHGVRKMPAYGDQISVEDRWAIVLYIQALQRSRNASPADVPAHLIKTLRDL